MPKITNKQNIAAWSSIPDEILQNFGEYGDFSRQYLLNPGLFELLGNVSNKTILDAGCGTGYLARLLAKKGAKVTGIEPAKKLYEYAKLVERNEKLGITYIQEDLSYWKPVPNTFDVVISNMVFMDIPEYEAAVRNCIKALKHNGILLFSILHPCFEDQSDLVEKPYVATSEYFEEYEVKQTIGHFIHRPLSSYINFIIQNGCSIEMVLEPKLSDELEKQFPQRKRAAHVPLFLVVKAKKS